MNSLKKSGKVKNVTPSRGKEKKEKLPLVKDLESLPIDYVSEVFQKCIDKCVLVLDRTGEAAKEMKLEMSDNVNVIESY